MEEEENGPGIPQQDGALLLLRHRVGGEEAAEMFGTGEEPGADRVARRGDEGTSPLLDLGRRQRQLLQNKRFHLRKNGTELTYAKKDASAVSC